MHPLMAARGHRLVTPTYTGLGERGQLARPEIDLETHIADILGVLKFEDLSGGQPGRSFLWRHGRDRRRRPRAGAHREAGLCRRLRARGRRQRVRLASGIGARAAQAVARRFHSAGRNAARHRRGRSRLARAAAAAAAGQDLRAEAEISRRPADAAAPLHLLHAPRARLSAASTTGPSTTARSTPATIRTSPVPRCWRRCSTASRASGIAGGDARPCARSKRNKPSAASVSRQRVVDP